MQEIIPSLEKVCIVLNVFRCITDEEDDRAAIHDNNSGGYYGTCDSCGEVIGVRNGEDPRDYFVGGENVFADEYQEYDEYPEEEETEVTAE